jgi:hypothetical protein
MTTIRLTSILVSTHFALAAVARAEPPAAATSTPEASAHQEHFHGVDARGDQGMGFNHQLTRHHFYLFAHGGAIEVEANDPKDLASRQAIREHLKKIAALFAAGDFSIPMFVHASAPPGMETMKRLKSEIFYAAEETPRGAQVRITTRNAEAIKAIHQFLRFQIKEHRTGDPLEVTKLK